MNDIKILVSMLLKDRLDLKFLRSKGEVIRAITFFLLRFFITFAVAFGVFLLSSYLQVFHNSKTLPSSLLTMILTLLLAITTVSVTLNLVKTLFLAEDNKLLITFPIEPNRIFLSKIIIFYIFELIKNVTFMLPILLAFGALSKVSIFFYFWIFVSMFFIALIPVVLGIALSLPALLIQRVFARFRLIKHTVYIGALTFVIYIIVRLILIIPTSINIIHYWGPIKTLLSDIMTFFYTKFRIIHYLVIMILGKNVSLRYTYWHYEPWLVLLILIAVLTTVLAATYFLVRRIFLNLISHDHTRIKEVKLETKRHKQLPRFLSFVKKEILLLGRTGEFTYNYAITYVGTPLIILLINKIFSSMELYANGWYFVQALNVLIIMLLLLSSNSAIAKSFSEEGRTGYLKRTKPINVFYALVAKLIPNITLSIISLIVTMGVFNVFMNYKFINIFLLTFGLILIQVGHIFISGLLDVMNPQNEQYATTGEQFSNPNESKSTIIAFITSFIIALAMFWFLKEAQRLSHEVYNAVFLKMFFIGILFISAVLYVFSWSVRAYYFDRGEAR